MTTALALCPSCGAENLGTRFCESCGAPAPAAEESAAAAVAPDVDAAPAAGATDTEVAATPVGPAPAEHPWHGLALRSLGVGAVALMVLPALAGVILALLGGLAAYHYVDYGFAGAGRYFLSPAVALAWPLTLILVLLVGGAGLGAALTSNKTTLVKAGAAVLAVGGVALFALPGAGWLFGGSALVVAWILLTGMRGWSYFTLVLPVVASILAWDLGQLIAEVHLLLVPLIYAIVGAATVGGVVLLGQWLSAAHARRPPKPPRPPRPVAQPVPAPAAQAGTSAAAPTGTHPAAHTGAYPAAVQPGVHPPVPPAPGGAVVGAPGYPTAPVVGQAYPTGAVVVPGYAPGYPMMQQRTNGFALASLILGLLTGTLLAIIFGHVALSQIRRTGERGTGMATAGLILGYFWTAVLIVYIIFVISTAARYF